MGHDLGPTRERILVRQTKPLGRVDVFVDGHGDNPAELTEILIAEERRKWHGENCRADDRWFIVGFGHRR